MCSGCQCANRRLANATASDTTDGAAALRPVLAVAGAAALAYAGL